MAKYSSEYFLGNHNLKDALKTLYSDAKTLYDWELLSRLETLRTNYRYMLRYIKQGVLDPDVEQMYARLMREAYDCLDRSIYLKDTLKYPKLYAGYFDKSFENLAKVCKSLLAHGKKMSAIMAYKADSYQAEQNIINLYSQYAELVDRLFGCIWLSPLWSEDEKNAVWTLLESGTIDYCAADVIVSAVNVSLIQHFDLQKYSLLLDIYMSAMPETTRLKALVGFMIATKLYRARFNDVGYMSPYVDSLLDSADKTRKLMVNVKNSLVLCAYNKELEKKFNNKDFVVGFNDIQKLSLENREKFLRGQFSSTDQTADPMVKYLLKKSEKFRNSLMNFYGNGADIYYVSFKFMKGHQFFSKPSHWFYPYNPLMSSDLMKLFSEEKPNKDSVFDMLLRSDSLCDSDKYSILLETDRLSPSQRQFLFSNRNTQALVNGMPNFVIWDNRKPEAESIIRHYMQDLYRFFNLWSDSKSLHVDEYIWFHRNDDPLNKAFDVDDWLQMAECMISVEQRAAADSIFFMLRSNSQLVSNADVWKKAGLNLEKQQDFESAVEFYNMALQDCPDDEWTLRHKAVCLEKDLVTDEAKKTFEKLVELYPDNMDNLSLLAHFEIKNGLFEDALKHLYKIDFQNGYSEQTVRSLGWCHLMCKQLDKAQRCYQKVIDSFQEKGDEAEWRDWLNLGHVHLVAKRLKEAVKCYSHSLKILGDFDKFENVFLSDYRYLGIESSLKLPDWLLRQLILDAIR